MKEVELEIILQEHIECFHNNILIEIEKYHDQWYEDFGFPLFGISSRDYYEQTYFQSHLESYTRNLVNSVLMEMADKEAPNEMIWPEFDYKGYKGYTNKECERFFGFEFIDRHNRIGYRYYFDFEDFDKVNELLEKNEVDTIKIIEWNNEEESWGLLFPDQRIKTMVLWELFLELFEDANDEDNIRMMYNLFIDRIANAVEKANSMISLVTLPGFTPSYFHKNRKRVLKQLREEVGKLSCFQVSHREYKSNEVNSKRLIQEYQLSSRFLKETLERS